jgi:hypothetical protein
MAVMEVAAFQVAAGNEPAGSRSILDIEGM